MMTDLVKKYAAPVPRYTSYPTAPHFTSDVDADVFARWLRDGLPADPLSLYLHIPFCRTLCWYCGCNTKATKRHGPVAKYISVLLEEMRLVQQTIGRRQPVAHIHLGGGSPDILSPTEIACLGEALNQHFALETDAEIAVEIDPRNSTADRVAAFQRIGVNRVSFGVQDFDPDVQEAINRLQSYDDTANAIALFRNAGIPSVNVDLIFGLPKQTCESIEATTAKVLELRPDRIALFGYAHLPERIKHQRMIDSAAMPDASERFAQATLAARMFVDAGYVRVGLDHLALPDDTLVTQPIRRNFQGYTTDSCSTLIGLGASSISRMPSGFAQNAVPTGTYMKAIQSGQLATTRGIVLCEDDRMRSAVIDDLMCRLSLSRASLRQRFGARANAVIAEADMLARADQDGFFQKTRDGYAVTEQGRPFIRTICACFDAYLGNSQATHASGV